MTLKLKLGGGGGSAAPTNKPGAGKPTTSASSLRDKFQRRSGDVLTQTYEQREERSKGSGGGKSLFNQDVLKELGVVEFRPAWGGNFVEILPPTFEPGIPYFLEVPVHYRVGINNDAFLCMKRFDDKACFRCETQRQMFRQNSTMTDEIKALYPNDRCIYLLWDRTDELQNNADQTYEIKVWAAPKSKVHAPIQSATRDKRTREIRDISDVAAGGQGRTVYFDAEKTDVAANAQKGTRKAMYPTYGGFDLVERDIDIPEEVLEKLSEIIEYAAAQGVAHPLEIFLHIPEDGEIKESMAGDLQPDDDEGGEAPAVGAAGKAGGKPRATLGAGGKAAKPNEDAIAEELSKLQDDLMAMNPLKFKMWCKANGVPADTDLSGDRGQLVDAIIEALFEQKMGGGGKADDDIPF